MNRRGFLGLLGGALLGKVLGPKLLATPDAALWKEAIKLPAQPVINQYLPMEHILAEMLKIVDQELAWLRIPRVYEPRLTQWGARFGDSVHVRAPVVSTPLYGQSYAPEAISERFQVVNLSNTAHALLPPDVNDRGWPEISESLVPALATGLARSIEGCIRASGGADVMVVADCQVVDGIDQCVIAKSEESSLSLRGVRWVELNPDQPNYGWNTRVDMLYGLA
jgi:hypothetical protein